MVPYCMFCENKNVMNGLCGYTRILIQPQDLMLIRAL